MVGHTNPVSDPTGAHQRAQGEGWQSEVRDAEPEGEVVVGCQMRVVSAYFEYYLRHPACRMFNALMVIVANFMLYAEDPMAHSLTTADLPGVGHAVNLLLFEWPDKFGLVCLKLLCAVVGVGVGFWFGRKIIHHKCLRDCLKSQVCEPCLIFHIQSSILNSGI